jgi:hypothetical protein
MIFVPKELTVFYLFFCIYFYLLSLSVFRSSFSFFAFSFYLFPFCILLSFPFSPSYLFLFSVLFVFFVILPLFLYFIFVLFECFLSSEITNLSNWPKLKAFPCHQNCPFNAQICFCFNKRPVLICLRGVKSMCKYTKTRCLILIAHLRFNVSFVNVLLHYTRTFVI